MSTNNERYELNKNLAQMLKGGVIMDVTTPEQAKIAEEAGACAVMALERIPADIRAAGGVSRMSDPKMIRGIQEAVSIPVMAKCRIGHFVEAQILEAIEIDYIDESEVLSPADDIYHINKKEFKVPFVCGARDLGEALRRIAEGASMIRTKGEPGTGDVVQAVRHMRAMNAEIRRIQKQLNITTIFVTHDQDEAMVMSDRICLLNCGKIEQMDTPIAIYTHPRTKFAAGFIGSYNVLEPLEFGRVTGDIDLPAQPIAIRPEVLNIAREKQNLPGTYDIEGTVIDSTPRGNVLRYKVDVNGVQLSADTLFRSFSIYENGSKVWLSLEKRNCLHVEEEAV